MLHGVKMASPSCLGDWPGAEAWLKPSLALLWPSAPECLLRSWSVVPRQEAGGHLPGDPGVRTAHAAGMSPQDSAYRGSAVHLEGWLSLSRF